MATKQEKAVHRAFLLGIHKGKIREEKHILWFLIALILLLLYLLGAQSFGWWPFARPTLGSAFYTNVAPRVSPPADMTTGGGSGSSSGASGSQSATGSGSSSSGGMPSGSSSSTPSGSGPGTIANFAAGVNVGNTKAQTSGQASGLGQNCAIVLSANASTGGKQEVCTYTQGDKIVTITYLNDRVISASKSGF